MTLHETTIPPRRALSDAEFCRQLALLAREQRRDLCGTCAGSATRPCGRCARQRAHVVALNARGLDATAIAARVGLPTWRAEQLAAEQAELAQRGPLRRSAREGERRANAELLRPDLGGLVDVLLAGPENTDGTGWDFDRARDWSVWLNLSLALAGWNGKTVNTVLDGTHIPTAPLRERVRKAKAAYLAATGEPLANARIAEATGIGCGDGTYIDRLLGIRRTSITARPGGRRYGGTLMKAIKVEHAAAIAAALGIAHYEIPGL